MQTLQQKCDHDFVKAPDNGETVCRLCGEVQESFSLVHRIPFGQTYQPTNMLTFGKSLGNTLDNRFALMRVLAKSPNGKKDIGLRAREIRILTLAVEPTPLKNALQNASKALIALGFGENHLFSNEVGSVLRKSAVWLLLAKCKFKSKELADACIYYTFTKYNYVCDPPPKRNNGTIETNVLQFRQKYLDLVRWVDQSTKGF
jgi:hypothetical protein